jgi:hypothetical protein
MNDHDDCLVCQLFWSQYLKSALAHLKLERRLQHTSATRDREAAEGLTLQVTLAETRKEQIREAICRHDADAHANEEAKAVNASVWLVDDQRPTKLAA